MKRTAILLSVLLFAALLSGCGLFTASPIITSFTADETTIDAGDSVTFTVKGSTKDPNSYSDLVDYSATVKITSSPAGISEEATVDESEAAGFEITKTVQFSEAGTYTMTADLITDSDSATNDSVVITVNDPKPWSDADTSEPYSISSGGSYSSYSISPSGDTDWFKFTASATYYVIHWQDSYDQDESSSYTVDVKVSVYNADGVAIVENQDSGYSSTVSSSGTGYGIRIDAGTDYTAGESIYIKVESLYASSSGSYAIYVY